MTTPIEAFAIDHYDIRVSELAASGQLIPMTVPMTRFAIIRLLHQAQVAELYDPTPDDMLDGGSE